MHRNYCSTSQISVGCIGIFDDNTENIVDTCQTLIENIDDTYRIGLVKRYRTLLTAVFISYIITCSKKYCKLVTNASKNDSLSSSPGNLLNFALCEDIVCAKEQKDVKKSFQHAICRKDNQKT